MTPAASARMPTGRLAVFIADDSATIRERLAELLSSVDGVVIVGQAEDVASAESGIQRTAPDVAIVDIQMPGGTGIDVLRKVKRGQPGGPSFIMYTNFGTSQHRAACAEAGADFFFDKATDTRTLADAIRMLAAQRVNPPASVPARSE